MDFNWSEFFDLCDQDFGDDIRWNSMGKDADGELNVKNRERNGINF